MTSSSSLLDISQRECLELAPHSFQNFAPDGIKGQI